MMVVHGSQSIPAEELYRSESMTSGVDVSQRVGTLPLTPFATLELQGSYINLLDDRLCLFCD